MVMSEEDCIALLQTIRWDGKPICPYCTSTKCCSILDHRFHCNSCNAAFSVTVQTIFHQTRISLTKWFIAISFVTDPSIHISSRSLAIAIGVNKHTGYRILQQIDKALIDPVQNKIIQQIGLHYKGGNNV